VSILISSSSITRLHVLEGLPSTAVASLLLLLQHQRGSPAWDLLEPVVQRPMQQTVRS